MWHVSSCSGVATLRTAIHLLLTYLLVRASFVTFDAAPRFIIFCLGLTPRTRRLQYSDRAEIRSYSAAADSGMLPLHGIYCNLIAVYCTPSRISGQPQLSYFRHRCI